MGKPSYQGTSLSLEDMMIFIGPKLCQTGHVKQDIHILAKCKQPNGKQTNKTHQNKTQNIRLLELEVHLIINQNYLIYRGVYHPKCWCCNVQEPRHKNLYI